MPAPKGLNLTPHSTKPKCPHQATPTNSLLGLLTENGRISKPKTSSTSKIRTPDNPLNSRLQKPLKAVSRNMPCRALLPFLQLSHSGRLERVLTWVIYLTSQA